MPSIKIDILNIISVVSPIYIQEVIFMTGNVNQAIKCTVQQCKHHATGQNYCSLREILVGTHEGNPTESQCTDCKSFVLK